MANKKYPEFPPGAYNPSKLILQADPVTGALEQLNISSLMPIYAAWYNLHWMPSTPKLQISEQHPSPVLNIGTPSQFMTDNWQVPFSLNFGITGILYPIFTQRRQYNMIIPSSSASSSTFGKFIIDLSQVGSQSWFSMLAVILPDPV